MNLKQRSRKKYGKAEHIPVLFKYLGMLMQFELFCGFGGKGEVYPTSLSRKIIEN